MAVNEEDISLEVFPLQGRRLRVALNCHRNIKARLLLFLNASVSCVFAVQFVQIIVFKLKIDKKGSGKQFQVFHFPRSAEATANSRVSQPRTGGELKIGCEEHRDHVHLNRRQSGRRKQGRD